MLLIYVNNLRHTKTDLKLTTNKLKTTTIKKVIYTVIILIKNLLDNTKNQI